AEALGAGEQKATAPLGAWTATAERYVAGGSTAPSHADALPELSARGLRELVRMAPAADAAGDLEPMPPWFGFGQRQSGLWPQLALGDPHGDLAHATEAGIDDAARR